MIPFKELFKQMPWWFMVLWIFGILASMTITSLLVVLLIKLIGKL